jgi:hypothetical protein
VLALSGRRALTTCGLCSTARVEMPPLRGVFHSAVVFDEHRSSNGSRAVLAGDGVKAGGAWNLHALTLEQELDHFVLFSSVSS